MNGRSDRGFRRAVFWALLLALSFGASTSRAQVLSPLTSSEPPALIFTIDVKWSGSSSYRLERDVTVKIENAVKGVPGVLKVHSTAIGARSQTSLWFDAKTDASSTASAIRAKLDQIRTKLPRDASQPLIAWRREPAVDR